MNIELTDLDMILDYLETTSLEPHDDYTSEFTYKDQKILYKYIKQLQQENQKLKDNWKMLKHNLKVVIKRHHDYCKENSTNEFDIDYLMADTTMKNYAAFLSIVEFFEGSDSNEKIKN